MDFCIIIFTNKLFLWVFSQEKTNKFEHRITSIMTECIITTNVCVLEEGKGVKGEGGFSRNFLAGQILGNGKSLMKRVRVRCQSLSSSLLWQERNLV